MSNHLPTTTALGVHVLADNVDGQGPCGILACLTDGNRTAYLRETEDALLPVQEMLSDREDVARHFRFDVVS